MERFFQFLFVFTTYFFNIYLSVEGIGVNYGLVADNLPAPRQVIELLKSRNVKKIRIFEPNFDVLDALEGSDMEVIVGVRNEDLQKLATDPAVAIAWVASAIIPHVQFMKFTAIAVGNEVIPGPLAQYVLDAIQNLDAAFSAAWTISLPPIPITTAVSLQVLATSFPPSAGSFSDAAAGVMAPIAEHLAARGTPLLVNVYPSFARAGDRANVALDFALLKGSCGSAPPMKDNELVYENLFDAMVDAAYSALEKIGGVGVEIVVSETGWPSDGDVDATVVNAQTYVNNVIARELSGVGTPKRPGKAVQTYLFALFNEDQKPAGVEQNFGLYHPDMTEVYHVNFPA